VKRKLKRKSKKAETKSEKKTGGKAWRESEFKGKGRNDFRKERRVKSSEWDEEASKRRKHEIVIIPIFWRANQGEECAVTSDAQRIKDLLLSIAPDLDVWIDRTYKKSPGQKFAFWETVGVQCRIELGPEDVKNKRCVIATCVQDLPAQKCTVSSIKRSELFSSISRALPYSAQSKFQDFDPDMEDALADLRESRLVDETIATWTSISSPRRSMQPKASRGTGEGIKVDATAKKSISLSSQSSKPKIVFDEPATRNDDELDDDQQWAINSNDEDTSASESDSAESSN